MDYTPDRQDRHRAALWALGFVLIALVCIAAINAKAAATIPAYQPLPTPIVVDRGWEIHIGSDNCVGWNVSCNNH